MQILMVTQEFPPHVIGGVGYHAYHLADALVDAGHDVHVLTGTSERHTAEDSLPPVAGVTVSTLEYRRAIAPRLWFARRARRWLASWDRLGTFDLLHAHEYLDFSRLGFGGTTIQKVHFNLTEKPKYLSLDGAPWPVERAAFGLAGATIWRAERRLERRAVGTADAVIANSRLTRAICADRHSVPPADIDVVYNGVDGTQFAPADVPACGNGLLFVGGDSERKGFGRLLAAVRRLDAEDDVIPVTVAGEVAADRERLAATLPVEFVGRVDQARLLALYRDAAALIHPAVFEPFGNVVLEALACGTPVVVSDREHCGAAELVDDQVGLVIDPDDPRALGEAMRAVVEPDRFDAAACRAVAEEHPWDRVAERTVEIARSTP